MGEPKNGAAKIYVELLKYYNFILDDNFENIYSLPLPSPLSEQVAGEKNLWSALFPPDRSAIWVSIRGVRPA